MKAFNTAIYTGINNRFKITCFNSSRPEFPVKTWIFVDDLENLNHYNCPIVVYQKDAKRIKSINSVLNNLINRFPESFMETVHE